MNRERISKRPLPPRKLPSECLCCGEENPWVINKIEFVAPFRDTEHVFRAEVNQCRHCDAVATTEEQSEAISAKVRESHRKWMSERLKAAQRELGLSLRELADRTSIPFATLGRVSSGEHLIEATVEKLLWMQIGELTHERMMERLFQMKQREFRITNGSVLVKHDPDSVRAYAAILQTAAQSPLGKCSAFGLQNRSPEESYSNLAPA
jgi:transcriptional regulator with XRE-family HTH domain